MANYNPSPTKGRYGIVTRAALGYLKEYCYLTDGHVPQGVLSEISRKLGVSRERIRQIAKREGYIMNRSKKVRKVFECVNCHKEFSVNRINQKYCSLKCRIEHRKKRYFITFKCQICGKEKTQYKSKGSGVFCSKTCHGRYLGQFGRRKVPFEETNMYYDLRMVFASSWFSASDYEEMVGKTVSNLYRALVRYPKSFEKKRDALSIIRLGAPKMLYRLKYEKQNS